MKRLLAMALGLALSSAAAVADTPYTIAFSLKTVTNDDFQKAIATSIQQAVEKSGNKFLLVTAGDETGVSIQVNQVEDLIAKKVDAIVLNPMDGKSVVPVLKKAQAAKIPVIVVDSSVEKGNESLYISYVGTDNFNAGKVAGQRMVKELGGQGNVLIVRGANGSSAGDQRVDGFKAGIEGSGLKVVGEQPGNWTNSVAMQVTENMLQANKKVDGLFSASDVMLDGDPPGHRRRQPHRHQDPVGGRLQEGGGPGGARRHCGHHGPVPGQNGLDRGGQPAGRARRQESRRQHPQGDRLRHHGLRQDQSGRSAQVGVLRS